MRKPLRTGGPDPPLAPPLVQALNVADSILSILDDMRADAECVFADLVATVVTLFSDLDVEAG